MHHPTDRITHTTAFVTPVVEHWLNGSTIKVLSDDPSHNERTFLPRSYISLLLKKDSTDVTPYKQLFMGINRNTLLAIQIVPVTTP